MGEEVFDPSLLRCSADGSHSANPQTVRCPELEAMQERLRRGDARMNRIEVLLDQNCSDTSEVLDILRMGKSFFRLLGYLGAFIKWVAAIAAPLLALYFTLKDGHK
ncbi:MAG: hypothetical protein WCN21_05490 [Comamonadaceae bacterium]